MSSDAELQLIYKVANAPVNMFPFPHFYVRDIFPDDFYARLQAMLPDPSNLRSLPEVRPVPKDSYKERFVIGLAPEALEVLPDEQRAFWMELRGWLLGGATA